MTLLLAEGGDNQLRKIYAKTAGVTWFPNQGISGGGALYVPFGNSDFAQTLHLAFAQSTAPTYPRTIRISFWIKSSVALTSITSTKFMNFFRQSSGYSQCMVYLSTPTTWVWDRAYSLVGQTFWSSSTSPLNILDGNWHHVFMAVRYANSGGLVKLKIDNKSFTNVIGDTVEFSGDETTPTLVYFHNIRTATAGGYYLDDIVAWDSVDTGDGFHDIDIPPTRIYTLRPSADTAQAQSYPSIGSSRSDILKKDDANGSNGVVTLEPGKSDLYEFDDLSENANVRAVVMNMEFATGQVSSRANLRILITANNVNYAGNTYSTQSLSINNPYMEDWTVWPSGLHANNKFAYISLRDFGNSNVAWAQTSINGLKIGLENTGVP